MIPVMIDFNHKRILVVGFGAVGQRKASVLAGEGALITVVARNLPELLRQRFPSYTFREGAYDVGDMDHMDFVVAATNQRLLNIEISREAKRRHLLCSIADDGSESDFTFMSVVNRGDLSIGISTKHRFPGLTKKVKDMLEAHFPEDYGDYVDYMAKARAYCLTLPEAEKKKGLSELLEITYDVYKQGRD